MTERMYTEQEVMQYMQRAVEAYETGEVFGIKQGIALSLAALAAIAIGVRAAKKHCAKKAEEIY